MAFHMPMIRQFKSLALQETAEGVLPETTKPSCAGKKISAKEVWQVYLTDEIRLEKRREYINTHPDLVTVINQLIDWATYGNLYALENFLRALRVYERVVSAYSGHKLAAIYTIWACNWFWERGYDKGNLNARIIRDIAIQLWEETEQLTGQKRFEDKVKSPVWPRLFNDLGIELVFQRGAWL